MRDDLVLTYRDVVDPEPAFAVRKGPSASPAVADGQSASIRIYADDDTFVRQWGQAGDGPGEFGWIPVISELLSDHRGRLWTKRYEPAIDSHWLLRQRTGGSWLVMEPGGDPVALVSMPDGFRLMDVRGDRVAGVSRDELGVERVEVRRLDRSP